MEVTAVVFSAIEKPPFDVITGCSLTTLILLMGSAFDVKVVKTEVRGAGVSVGATASTVGDGGIGVGVGVSVGRIISVAAIVGDASIWVGSDVKVGMNVGDAKGVSRGAVGVGVGVEGNAMAAWAWTGIENSTCNRGAPAELPSNDFATRLPLLLPTMIITMEFPEIQLDWLTIS